MNDLLSSSQLIFDVPDRLTDVRSWHGHLPFAFWLVETCRPRTFVELGTHRGDSYCAFCQAVSRLDLPTRCYAVDTWRGDPHAGLYGEDVYQELGEYHARYAGFSSLVRSTFDEAVTQFGDGSIDLLHVDGLHTYEAVKHDFETWRPKLTDDAIVLFHDVNVREHDFGVWRYWEELAARHPSFTFLHSSGLGVLAPGQRATALEPLFTADEARTQQIRRAFTALGDACLAGGRLADERAVARRSQAELAQARLAWDAEREKLLGAVHDQERFAHELVARVGELQGSEAAVTEKLRVSDEARRRLEARLADVGVLRVQATAECDAARAQVARHEETVATLRRELEEARLGAHLAQVDLRRRIAQLVEARKALARVPEPLRRALAEGGRISAARGRAARVYRRVRGTAGALEDAARVLRESGHFDVGFYLERNPDVETAGADPVAHYLQYGAAEGRDPNPVFSTAWYLEQNPDVRESGINPLLHFVRHGAAEGRRPGPTFDGHAYLRRYPDLVAAGVDPVRHFLEHGQRELRDGRPDGAGNPAPEGFDLERWARGRRRPPDGRPAFLVVDHRLPMPDVDSGSVRMFALVELLIGLGFDVTFVSDADQPLPRYERALRQLGVEVRYAVAGTEACLRAEGGRFRYALLSRPGVCIGHLAAVRALAPEAQVVYDTVDLHWLRVQRAAELLGDAQLHDEAREHRKAEGFGVTCADLVLAVTETERQKILETWPGVRAAVVPNVHRCRPLPRPWSERRGLMFIGGFEHAPNVDAVTWFAREVLPLVAAELPDVRFRVVGSKPPEGLKELESGTVEVVGYVPEAEPEFDAARVFVAPLRYGAGMKGKIGQAMSLGLPVVTTGIGAEGMGLSDGVHALIADDPAAFASAVLSLYRDELLWNELRAQGLRLVQERFSADAIRDVLRQIFTLDQAGPRSSAVGA